jgi:hypothetical protein
MMYRRGGVVMSNPVNYYEHIVECMNSQIYVRIRRGLDICDDTWFFALRSINERAANVLRSVN